ncbi:hypothetical protein N1031_06570 [Herbiconiux moechotypicola]|uniref:SnoaL-like domain-containing protein n=1 Tax=Herbiconiux moechotypicola TaxID=637393 RepID=A0ABN3DG50_9MICO|nr:hypothetical protein [Herbiconiux moechotypicola]MCS5729421.1 hypothetical protein [Herbiconiux moechotypicola]
MAQLSLPSAVGTYVTAVNGHDLDGIVGSFIPTGVIVDVGRHIEGHGAIRRWAETEVVGGRLDVLEEHPTAHGADLLVRFTPPGSASGFRAWYRFAVTEDGITQAGLTYA